MSAVNYGDTFLLYGFSADGKTQGWIVLSGSVYNSGQYFVICPSCYTGSSQPYPTFAFTIIPGVTSPNASTSPYINSNNQNVKGQPVQLGDLFYIGSNLINNSAYSSSWPSQNFYMSVTGHEGDVLNTNIASYPENGRLQASNFVNSSSNNFTYGFSVFNLSYPDNDPDGYCGSVGVKNSILGLDTANQAGGQYKFAPIYNNGDCSSPLTALNFVFLPLPVNGSPGNFLTCSGSQQANLPISKFNSSTLTPMYNTLTYQCPTSLWGCVNNSCTQGTGSQYTYPTQSACQSAQGSACYSPQQYGCINNTCSLGSGSQFTYNSLQQCQNTPGTTCYISNPSQWGCINNTCSQGTGSQYTYSSLAACQSAQGTACYVPPSWGCVTNNGTSSCISGTGNNFSYPSYSACINDSSGACYTPPSQNFGCISGTCQQGTGPQYTYSSLSACQSDSTNTCYVTPPTPPKSKSIFEEWWFWLIIVIAFIILIVIIIAIVMLTRKHK